MSGSEEKKTPNEERTQAHHELKNQIKRTRSKTPPEAIPAVIEAELNRVERSADASMAIYASQMERAKQQTSSLRKKMEQGAHDSLESVQRTNAKALDRLDVELNRK